MLQAFLAEQRRLTAVDRFADSRIGAAAGSGRYRELIPGTSPGPGEQYAFEVDLDRCSGCKACVTGCHSRNGLDDGETWRAIGEVAAGAACGSSLQTVTTACHHCADPGCLSGCPVLAYEKDPDTGIVAHLDDQCIGCRYCTMKCPYDVPVYDERRGIVRKCDLCATRLADGEAPACAEACPTEAIRIVHVARDIDAPTARAGFAAVPGAPDAAITLPTTRYVGARAQRGLRAAPADWPLVAMLVLTQSAVGMSVAGALAADGARSWLALAAASAALVGIAASITHLGRPLYAFRALLGLRTSWLSREVAAFGVYAGLAVAHAIAVWTAPGGAAAAITEVATPVAGVAAIACSAMVYIDTPRLAWSSPRTLVRFAVTTGLAALLSGALASLAFGDSAAGLSVLASAVVLTALATEASSLAKGLQSSDRVRRLGAGLTVGPLRLYSVARCSLGAAAAVALVGAAAAPAGSVWPLLALAAVFVLVSEFFERALFFRAVVVPRMPGTGSPTLSTAGSVR